ncbi:hypothetical protein [Flagellimonas amoyensis]|uniref:hypothetical protein n=1 Tax=Flagellimonas amoyensis TaxID=2169401 RepID=UPI00131F3691|nr:hypothetical protein [Allomuricauda amoyensis]
MKTKLFIFGLLSFFLSSCSTDDDHDLNTQIPAENQYLGKVTKPDGSDHVLISYDPDGSIHEIRQEYEQGFWLNLQYGYNNDHHIRAIYVSGEGISTINFFYDEQGNLSSYDDGYGEFPIQYHPAANLYEFDEGDDHCKVYLNEHGDVTKFSIRYFGHEEEEIYNFTYDLDKRGTLSNANPIALHTLIAEWPLFLDILVTNNLTSRPFVECQADGLQISSENSYGSNGFLKMANITNTQIETPGAISYEYIER